MGWTNKSIKRRLADVKFKQTFVTQSEYDEAIEGLDEDKIKELRLGIINKLKEAIFKGKYYILTKYYTIHK